MRPATLSLLCGLAWGMAALDIHAAEVNTHIRTLASSCVTCHGTNPIGTSAIPSLIGLDESYFIQKMQSYRRSADAHDVMTQHAKGLTEQEIQQLASYFYGQPRGCPVTKKHPADNWSR